MSNDASYDLRITHPQKDYLAKAKEYFSTAFESHKGNVLNFEIGPIRKVRLQEKYSMKMGIWGNEFAITIATDEGVIGKLLAEFPELDVQGTFTDDYGWGYMEGCWAINEDYAPDSDEEDEELVFVRSGTLPRKTRQKPAKLLAKLSNELEQLFGCWSQGTPKADSTGWEICLDFSPLRADTLPVPKPVSQRKLKQIVRTLRDHDVPADTIVKSGSRELRVWSRRRKAKQE